MTPMAAQRYEANLQRMPLAAGVGEITAFNGLVIESRGPNARLGEVCMLARGETPLMTQVVGFRQDRVLLMPYGSSDGLRVGDRIRATGRFLDVPVGMGFIGRVVDAFGAPLDGGQPVVEDTRYPATATPLPPMARSDVDDVLETGVMVLDTLLTMGKGQRVGVFAGSGVGKSTLLGMMARHVKADVVVLGLIGERGREVGDFVDNVLGKDGLRRAVVVAATSDQPALVRSHATSAAHAMAEYFRDRGLDVLLIVDSMTRYAMAQREIGLAAGEPPTTRGYPPSVFNRLPLLVERGGALRGKGSVSCIYSVLVEGDDMNEPVADHMRALLDGHIVLARDIAHRGRLPAVDVLKSVSRLMGRLATRDEKALAAAVHRLFATYESSRDLVDMGAHQRGVNALLDQAVELVPALDAAFHQTPDDHRGRHAVLEAVRSLLGSHGVVI